MDRITLFRTVPRIVMGPGAIRQLADEARALKAKKVLFVTDQGLIEAGLVKRAEAVLKQSGIDYSIFGDVEADPRYEIVADCVEMIHREKSDLVIGIGGGSPIDIAKMSAVMAANEDPISEYFGIDLVPRPGLPTLIIPTTAGTGSEVTPIVILSDHTEKLKKGVVSPYLFPSVALLDPELTVGLPANITAATGMDAFIHAVEAFTSKNASPITDMLARRAMDLVMGNLRNAYADGSNLTARTNMLESSLLAGMAFANAGVTAVHAFAYPIGAEFHIPHGVANSIMLVPVMEFNIFGNLTKFAEMAEIFDEDTRGLDELASAQAAVEAMRKLTIDLKIPDRLSGFNIQEKDIPQLAEGVMKVTRLLANNPRELKQSDAEEIYRRVL
ncbi:MAG: iron-containing alcohol dehydrogenase [Deltaproteobacteria bacterium]|nr:iron-containing alcohol dehydrogenase [Deltaproteobacteria bacterium]